MTLNIPNKEEMLKAQPDLVVTEGLDSFAFDPAQGFATIPEVEAMGAQVYAVGRSAISRSLPRAALNPFMKSGCAGRSFGISPRARN